MSQRRQNFNVIVPGPSPNKQISAESRPESTIKQWRLLPPPPSPSPLPHLRRPSAAGRRSPPRIPPSWPTPGVGCWRRLAASGFRTVAVPGGVCKWAACSGLGCRSWWWSPAWPRLYLGRKSCQRLAGASARLSRASSRFGLLYKFVDLMPLHLCWICVLCFLSVYLVILGQKLPSLWVIR